MTKAYDGFPMSQIRHLSGRVGEKPLKESSVDIFNGAQGRILYVLWEHEQLTISEIGRLPHRQRQHLQVCPTAWNQAD